MEALRQKALKAEVSAEKEAERFAQEMAKATESAKTACRTLRLALTDMGARVRGVPGEDAYAFDFSEWTQLAGGAVSDCATAYGNCCARVSVAFTMGLLQQFGCEYVAEFPNFAKEDWEMFCPRFVPSASSSGKRTADPLPMRVCLNNWRRQRRRIREKRQWPKMVEEMPKITQRVFAGNCVFGPPLGIGEVAGWMRVHPGRNLDDYDRVHVERLEDMRTDRQEAIAQRRYSIVCVSPPSPLRVVYDISSDDEPSSPSRFSGSGGCFGGEDVIFL
uniref:Uncharacterized protein n=1 Tax=Oryza nivara TaxID=4536 RepID=A0A0E0HZQ2_ORYNI